MFLNPNPDMALSKHRDQSCISNMKESILKYEMPEVLMYGDSHIVRMEEWLYIPYDPDNIYGPTPLDDRAMENLEFCAVGGTTTYTRKFVELTSRSTSVARVTSGIILPRC